MDIGTNVKYLRKLNSLKTQQLADLVGITRSQITKIETGVSMPSIEVLKKIAAAFNVTVSELICETPPSLTPELKALLDSASKLSPEQLKILTAFLNSLSNT